MYLQCIVFLAVIIRLLPYVFQDEHGTVTNSGENRLFKTISIFALRFQID